MKALLLAIATLAAEPCAAQFAVTDVQQAVAIEGHLQAVDSLTGALQQADAADARSAPPLQVGMSLALPEGRADAQGRASLELMSADRVLSFAALADVDTVGHGDGMLVLSGFGQATVDLRLHFTLAQAQTVHLAMDSSVTHERGEDFAFRLARDDGTPLWRETSVLDGTGSPSRAFDRALFLDAGGYEIVASLDAASRFDDAHGYAGRTAATVSLSLVPEPASVALLIAGLAALALCRRRP